MGPGPSRGAAAPFVVDRIDPETGALLAEQSVESGLRRARRLRRYGRAADQLDRRPTRNSSAATGRSACRRRCVTAAPLSGRTGSGLDPCAALQTRSSCRPTAATEIVFLLGDAPRRSQAQALIARYRRADLAPVLAEVRAFWDRDRRRRPGQARPTGRWTSCSTAGSPIRRSPAASGRASSFYQASGAYGFRDQLQDGMALAPSGPADHPRAPAPGRRHASSSRATFSTGGCRIRARACAPGFPTTGSGSPTPSPTTSASPPTPGCSTRSLAFLGGQPLAAGRDRQLLPAGRLGARPPASTSTARVALDASLARRRPRPAADRRRRLERRHEPRRRGGPGRKRLAGLVPARRRSTPSRRWPTRAASMPRARAGGPMPTACARRSSAMPGTATGIGAAGSTTARRSARRPTRNAASTRSPSPGRCSPAPAGRTARARRPWRRSSGS